MNTLVQVVFDGPGADEQPRTDLRIRQAVTREPGDLRLLGGEPIAGLDAPLAGRLTDRQQLARRALL